MSRAAKCRNASSILQILSQFTICQNFSSPLGDDDNVFLFETSPHCTDMLSLFNEVIPDTDSPSSFPSAVILMYSLVYKIVEKYDLGVLNA